MCAATPREQVKQVKHKNHKKIFNPFTDFHRTWLQPFRAGVEYKGPNDEKGLTNIQKRTTTCVIPRTNHVLNHNRRIGDGLTRNTLGKSVQVWPCSLPAFSQFCCQPVSIVAPCRLEKWNHNLASCSAPLPLVPPLRLEMLAPCRCPS